MSLNENLSDFDAFVKNKLRENKIRQDKINRLNSEKIKKVKNVTKLSDPRIKTMSDESPLGSGGDSPSSSSGFEGRVRTSPDSVAGFDANHYVNLSAAHQHAMAQAAMASLAGLTGASVSGKKPTVNNNLVTVCTTSLY